MKLFRGLFWGLVFSIVLWIPIIILAQEFISEDTVAKVPAKVVREIDNITINPNSKVITVRTFKRELDAKGNTIRTEPAPSITIRNKADNPDTPEDESTTDFNDFIKELGLSKSKLIKAIKNYLGK